MSQTRHLAAILAVNVAGYSRLIRVDEEGARRTECDPPRTRRPENRPTTRPPHLSMSPLFIRSCGASLEF
jgi:hypothetical protein